jgi:hypothetical protein
MTRRRRPGEHAIYLEVGDKRVFAGAIDWPAWARSGRDEDAVLEALFAYAPRYARALKGTRLGFEVPRDPSALRVVERLPGTATTDFGAVPGVLARVRPSGGDGWKRGADQRSSWGWP